MEDVLGFLFFVLLFVVFGSLGIWLINKKQIKRSSCPNCKAFYDYDSDVEWEVNNETSDNRQEKTLVEFSCVCPNCGHEKNFTHEFITAQVLNAGTPQERIKRNNLENMTRSLFLSNKQIEKITRKKEKK